MTACLLHLKDNPEIVYRFPISLIPPYNCAPSVMAITIYTTNLRCIIVAVISNCNEMPFLVPQCKG